MYFYFFADALVLCSEKGFNVEILIDLYVLNILKCKNFPRFNKGNSYKSMKIMKNNA